MEKRCLGCMEIYDDESGICPKCGFVNEEKAEEAIHMNPGTLLNDRYVIGKVIGYGGFGVTYIAWDGKLEQKVAIKEYLPSEFSTRIPGESTVTIFSGDKSEQFRSGLEKFVDEAKRLAKYQNEDGIVKIFDAFEENLTAYIVMEYLDGMTLSEYLKRNKTIDENDAVKMLEPVMKSLINIHSDGLLHRDIAPDNIFITKKGECKLIDFGASRFATTKYSRSLTVIVKPGYSPEEQYRSRGDQGTYTDVYALAATLYKMITGNKTPDAMVRRAKYENENTDILVPPHKIKKNISKSIDVALLNALNVSIEDRTKDVETFMKELNADPPAKRKYGKIKKIDFYEWPAWLKMAVSAVASLITIFGILMLVGVISFKSNYSKEVVVPDNISVVPNVEGLGAEDAIEEIEKNKLIAVQVESVESEYIEAGKVIIQNPPSGSYMDVNGVISLVISSGSGEIIGPVNGISTVPYLVLDTKEEAEEKLEKAGLGKPEIKEEYNENVEKGKVVSQSAKAGEKIKEKTVITLVISLGAKSFKMPDVTGLSEQDATKKLTDLGLVVSVQYKKSDNYDKDVVFEQSIGKDKDVKRGDKVLISVNSNEIFVKVDNVVGMTKENAIKTLEKSGFSVRVLESYYSDNTYKGKVAEQSPEAGLTQKKGSSVIIYVSKGAKENVETTSSTPMLNNETQNQTNSPATQQSQAPAPAKTTTSTPTPQEQETTIKAKREYEYTTSTSSSLSGWEQYASDVQYGNWSGWTTKAISGSGTLEVETRTVEGESYTQSTYGYYTDGTNFYASSIDGMSLQYCEYIKTSIDSKTGMVQSGNGYRLADNTYLYYPNEVWFLLGSENKKTASHTEYRSRTKTMIYYYRRYKN